MRERIAVMACALIVAFASAGSALADGSANNQPWAVREPKGPADKSLAGSPPKLAAKPNPAPPPSGAASGSQPPAAPPMAEQAPPKLAAAAPSTPVVTQSLDGAAAVRPASGGPVWRNRWFWALLALILLVMAALTEWLGRKHDEARAAEEPEDAPKAV